MTDLAAHDFALYAIEPEPPRDPFAAATSAEQAVARHLAVVGLPIDERGQRLLRALAALDAILIDSVERGDFGQSMALVDSASLKETGDFEAIVLGDEPEPHPHTSQHPQSGLHQAPTQRLGTLSEADVPALAPEQQPQPAQPQPEVCA